MIELAFTLDYEIYGNGLGCVQDLVLQPTDELFSVFQNWNAPFVVFAEALEFQKIEEHETDTSIGKVRDQLCRLNDGNCEIALHLHPWWFDAKYENGSWRLDWTGRNLCAAPRSRIEEVIQSAIDYLRRALRDSSFVPTSFRNGLWLMQPTEMIATALANQGVRIDSSVFKGGYIKAIGLDYRPALRNDYFWTFDTDVNVPMRHGRLLEIPIYTEMVAFWKMLTQKRLSLQRKVPAAANGSPLPGRLWDFVRLYYPRKLDFCRMSFDTLRSVMDNLIRMDRLDPDTYRIIVAIGHSKDLVDFKSVREFLSYLDVNGIGVVNLRDALTKIEARQQHRVIA